MVEFKTLEGEEVEFGKNNFIEIARKKAITEEGEERVFVSLSRGFRIEGEKRYKKNFSMPDDPEVIGKIAEALKSVVKGES